METRFDVMTRDDLIGDPRQELQYLTVKEVAHLLRVDHDLVYDLIHRGELRALRVGKHWRIQRRDVEALGRRSA